MAGIKNPNTPARVYSKTDIRRSELFFSPNDAVILHHLFHGEIFVVRLIVYYDVLRAHIRLGRTLEHPPPHEHQESAGLQKYHGP